MNDHIVKMLAIHHFVDRNLYYENCHCGCGIEFDYRDWPVKRWSQHVGYILCKVVEGYAMNLRPEPRG